MLSVSLALPPSLTVASLWETGYLVEVEAEGSRVMTDATLGEGVALIQELPGVTPVEDTFLGLEITTVAS